MINEKDEKYRMECGKMFLTTKDRVLFHCTLCDKKFDSFKQYEKHLKEHIATLIKFNTKDNIQTGKSVGVENKPLVEKETVQTKVSNQTDTEIKTGLCSKTENVQIEEIVVSNNQYCEARIGDLDILQKKENAFEDDFEFQDNSSTSSGFELDDKTFEAASSADILKHNTDTQKTVCPVCGKSVSTKSLKRHQNLHSEKANKCPKCEKAFSTVYKLDKHMKLHEINGKEHECPVCHKMVKINCLIVHMKKCHNKHKCRECDQIFDSVTDLRSHKITHEKYNKIIAVPEKVRDVNKRCLLIPEAERIHKCPICQLGFKDRYNMKHHLKRHTAAKDKKCMECNKAYFTSSELHVHMKRHNDERNFLCNICGKLFFKNFTLLEHMKIHGNERPYKCEHCNKGFYRIDSLNRHLKIHSSERPYACEICSMAFRRMSSLKDHLKLHDDKRDYVCKVCNAGFNQNAGLYSHMKTVHSIAKWN